MLFINKPDNPKQLVVFYSQLDTELKECSFDTSKMQNYSLTTVFEDFLEKKGTNPNPSNHLLRETFAILSTEKLKKRITDFMKKEVEQELLNRKKYFEAACLLPINIQKNG